MKHAIGVIVLLLASQAMGQAIKHDPTVEQCRTESYLWDKDWDSNHRYATQQSIVDIEARGNELLDCYRIDKDYNNWYLAVMNAGQNEIKLRAEHFFLRHKLERQFAAEDAAGKR